MARDGNTMWNGRYGSQEKARRDNYQRTAENEKDKAPQSRKSAFLRMLEDPNSLSRKVQAGVEKRSKEPIDDSDLEVEK